MRIAVATIAALMFASPLYAGEFVTARISVCFTPAEQCEGQIVDAIDKAQSSIRVQAYGFTAFPIIHALQRAAGRGVEVLAILDKTNERKYSGATLLDAAGIPVWIDFEPAIAHNKIMVIDERLTIGGSYNYTAAAQKRNAENVTFTDSVDIARQFLSNWDSRLKVSRAFEGARTNAPSGQ
ncbi:phospholipase D family protein [Rhizobium sp. 60-20]|uniref:phospholipase D family nuclease n=1 Tax=Rhizobium sp. 60-20 TaxID=1895819 RepID=UPI000A8F51E4|nr:phospholipase D family protein [Rhizobium sp. 60-20]